MFPIVDTKDPTAVEVEVQTSYLSMFPKGDRYFVPRAFGWILECFTGNYKDYQGIDARYHDFEHTLQVTLCLTRLLRNRLRINGEPHLTQKMFELGLLAILMHDTGYLKKRGDNQGTGAKYTLIHVGRSADFAGQLMLEKGYPWEDVEQVQQMIRCTGVSVDLNAIPFTSDLVRAVGFALGTSDLLGQMAAPDYVDKLPTLYSEFEESARFNAGKGPAAAPFSSAEDLIRKTPSFWEKYVLPKIERDFQGEYRFLNDPYPDGPNEYLRKIETNIARVREIAAGFAIAA
jgi:hypothetical protein